MRTFAFTLLALTGLTLASASSAADVDVMTQNQYLGADIAPLVEPGLTPEQFFVRVVEALQQVAANKPTERFAALAAEIKGRMPHLVGLQEVFSFECQPITAIDGCSSPLIAGAMNDHLEGTMAALGDGYYVVGQVTNLDVSLPLYLSPEVGMLIRVVDRDVILAHSDVPAASLPPAVVSTICPGRESDQGCNFRYVVPLGAPLNVNIERGYVMATALVNGRGYLFVNTHLETRGPMPFFQAAQAAELAAVLGALAPGLPPIILVGDFNSDPNDPTILPPATAPYPPLPPLPNPYVQLTAAGLNDAWLQRPGGLPGLSCCQWADLSNHNSDLYERIDLIWTEVLPPKVKDARVLGASVNFKTRPPGLGTWPSDHGAVAATLQFR